MFVRAANPIWYMVDTNGIPLNSGDYAFFLTNDFPYVPQAVYQDPFGNNPWSDPIEFQPSGTLPNNLYFDPTAVYRIEIRAGDAQTAPLIWLIENFTANGGGGGGGSVTDAILTSQNIVTNPQFSDLFVPTSYTFSQSISGTYTINIGPGWQLVLTGAGSTTLTQLPIAGSPAVGTSPNGNPPYLLTIANSGWTTAQLIQTFDNNGALYANGALALSFAATTLSVAQNITVSYVPSISSSPTVLFSGSIASGGLVNYYGASDVSASTNTGSGFSANTKLIFSISGSNTISFTNIQLLGQSTNLSSQFSLPNQTARGSVPLYQEEPYAVILNNEFHTYARSLITEAKNSILTGWNFGLNPWQFTPTTSANVPNNSYTADQTIIIQQNYVAAGTGNNIAVGQASYTYDSGFQVTAVTANNMFGVLQYIDPASVKPYWGSVVSSLVKASLVTSAGTAVQFKMRLIVNNTVPNTTSQTYPVASWTAGQDPAFNNAFTVIIPPGDPVYTLSGLNQVFNFDGMVLPAATSSTTTLGIILYTLTDMDQNPTADFIVLNDISLVPNHFAIASNPLTYDETLRACRFYYETSYESASLISGGSNLNSIDAIQGVYYDGVNQHIIAAPFSLHYDFKRSNPTVTLANPNNGTFNSVVAKLFIANGSGVAVVSANINNASSIWTFNSGGVKNCTYIPASSTDLFSSEPSASYYSSSAIYFQFIADSRLGV